ncbi:hypothetical protein K435DRAFT_567779, partial [Dendrothele bispora CBS 962.96]
MLGVPVEFVEWMRRRYAGRKTTLAFDDFVSDLFNVFGGEDQGDPFSAIGYVAYAAGALAAMRALARTRGYAFMDDLAALVWGETFEEVHLRMERLMKDAGGVMDWADLHNCSFGTDKFKLVD